MEQQNIPPLQNQEIDLIELVEKIWKDRKFILKICGIGVVLGLIIAFSIPKVYKTTVRLSPENTGINKNSQLGGLAAMAGLNWGSTTGNDALTPELYPDIVRSTPFVLEIVNLPVETQNGILKTTFYDYIINYQKSAWWGHITGAPFKALGWLISIFKEKENKEKLDTINPFKLTPMQENYVKSVQNCISIDVDKQTGAILASVTLQDPLVSATVMDVVLKKLQDYITEYRTRKAKNDLVFTEKLYKEAQAAYYVAQKKYATFLDANKNIISASVKAEEERLSNEMNLTYQVYSQMSQQFESSKVKVQEVTPVYVVIEPARVSLRADKPNKPIVLIGSIFFAGMIGFVWVLIRSYVKSK